MPGKTADLERRLRELDAGQLRGHELALYNQLRQATAGKRRWTRAQVHLLARLEAAARGAATIPAPTPVAPAAALRRAMPPPRPASPAASQAAPPAVKPEPRGAADKPTPPSRRTSAPNRESAVPKPAARPPNPSPEVPLPAHRAGSPLLAQSARPGPRGQSHPSSPPTPPAGVAAMLPAAATPEPSVRLPQIGVEAMRSAYATVGTEADEAKAEVGELRQALEAIEKLGEPRWTER